MKIDKVMDKHNIRSDTIKGFEKLFEKLEKLLDTEDSDKIVSTVLYLVGNSKKKFGNRVINEFNYMLNQDNTLLIKFFIKMIFNDTCHVMKIPSSTFGVMTDNFTDTLDDFLEDSNSYFKNLDDDEYESIKEMIKEEVDEKYLQALYTLGTVYPYSVESQSLDSSIYHEIIDLMILKHEVYSGFDITFSKRTLEKCLKKIKKICETEVTVHMESLHEEIISMNYEHDFEIDEDSGLGFCEYEIQSLAYKAVEEFSEMYFRDLEVVDNKSICVEYALLRGMMSDSKNILKRIGKEFEYKIGLHDLSSTFTKSDYKNIRDDSLAMFKELILSFLIYLNVQLILDIDTDTTKAKKFVLKNTISKLHLFGVELMDFGNGSLQTKLSYKPFKWSDVI
ncbi:MAG: hypothetical protein ACRCX8_12630 [Sarcina sp.]